ncbi:hypothetical protein [Methylobacterium tarhaniae]|uniref:hypothetical protein n=1 Tax=Methylobacterium tarhaniae TaxID=1187852 RepID=UPI003CFF64F0
MKSNHITHATDPDGRVVVGVRLTNAPGKTAWLYREDFERITSQHPGTWSLVDARKDKSYVRVKSNGHSVYIARLVIKAFERTAVSYKDDNTLNLRSSNLCIGTGNGGRPKRRKVFGFAALRIPTDDAGDTAASPARH